MARLLLQVAQALHVLVHVANCCSWAVICCWPHLLLAGCLLGRHLTLALRDGWSRHHDDAA